MNRGEKTANWQVRRSTTLLDWTGLDWRVTHIRLETWNGAHGQIHQGLPLPLVLHYLFTVLLFLCFSHNNPVNSDFVSCVGWVSSVSVTDDMQTDFTASLVWTCSMSQGYSVPLWGKTYDYWEVMWSLMSHTGGKLHFDTLMTVNLFLIQNKDALSLND